MKEIGDKRLAVVIEFTREQLEDGSLGEIEINCQAQYQITSDGLKENRQLPIELSPELIQDTRELGKEALRQVREKEVLSA